MKTIEQLLHLSKNPYYKLTDDEKQVLEDFLSKKQESESKSSRKKNSKRLEKPTNVRVRNIVEKTIPQPEELEDGQEPAERTE